MSLFDDEQRERENDRIVADSQVWGDDDEGWCDECCGTGELDCHCGGDICVCTNGGTYPCPDC